MGKRGSKKHLRNYKVLRARRRRVRRTKKKIAAALFAAILAITIVAVSIWLFFWSNEEPQESPKAAIVDQLSLTYPNPDFVKEATKILEETGYVVDYYPGEEVTVEFYRHLPTKNYGLLILRVHSALMEWDNQLFSQQPLQGQILLETLRNQVFLFTSENYDMKKYPQELRKAQLIAVRYTSLPDTQRYFGITPQFIRSAMKGNFDKINIFLMGCDGLTFKDMAEAFVQKGAKNVVSWNGAVSSSHTDFATQRLLKHLLLENLPLPVATRATMAEVGPDPVYGSRLLVYPSLHDVRSRK